MKENPDGTDPVDLSTAAPVMRNGQNENPKLDKPQEVTHDQDKGMTKNVEGSNVPGLVEQSGSKLLRMEQNGGMLNEKGLPSEFATRISRLLTIIAIKHDKVISVQI